MWLDTARSRKQFLFTEVELGLTMVECARLSYHRVHAVHSCAHARRAYEAVQHFRGDARLTPLESTQLDELMLHLATRLRSAEATYGKHPEGTLLPTPRLD